MPSETKQKGYGWTHSRSVTWPSGPGPDHIQFPVVRGRWIQVSNAKQTGFRLKPGEGQRRERKAPLLLCPISSENNRCGCKLKAPGHHWSNVKGITMKSWWLTGTTVCTYADIFPHVDPHTTAEAEFRSTCWSNVAWTMPSLPTPCIFPFYAIRKFQVSEMQTGLYQYGARCLPVFCFSILSKAFHMLPVSLSPHDMASNCRIHFIWNLTGKWATSEDPKPWRIKALNVTSH